MTKAELIMEVKRFNGGELKSFAAAKRVVETMFSTIEAATKRGERVTIQGFGSFEMKPARTSGRLITGERWTRPAAKALRFTPYKAAGGAGSSTGVVREVQPAPAAASGT